MHEGFRGAPLGVSPHGASGSRVALREAQSAGTLGADCRPEAVAHFLVAALEGAMLMTKLTKDIGVMEQCVAEIEALPGAVRGRGDDVRADTTKPDVDAALVEALRREEPGGGRARSSRRTAIGCIGWPCASPGRTRTPKRRRRTRCGRPPARSRPSRASRRSASWLYRIAANAAYQKLRARRVEGQRDRDRRRPADARRRGPPLRAHGRLVGSRRRAGAAGRAARRAGARRSTGCRPTTGPPLVLHDVEGLSNPDIAETLGISLPAVKSRVHRSRLFVRQRLAEYLKTA